MAFDPTFGKRDFALRLFTLRFRHIGISQRQFADRYGLSFAMVRDAEQGHKPCRPLVSLVALIEADPTGAAKLIETAGAAE